MAQYKCLPNYEYIRGGFNIQFNIDGHYFTTKENEIDVLDKLEPFIVRVDKPEEPKPAPKKAAPKSEESKK